MENSVDNEPFREKELDKNSGCVYTESWLFWR